MEINLYEVPIYYINLDKDVEKRERLEATLFDLGFENVYRFAGHYSKERSVGCATSHNALLNELKDIDTPFLILEDDVQPAHFKSLIRNIPEDADALYLGNSAFGLWGPKGTKQIAAEQVSPHLYRIYNMLSAHAILYLNNDYVKFLAKATSLMVDLKDNQDKSRAQTMKYFNVYALNKPMFYQEGRYAQVTNVSISRLNRVRKDNLFGL